MKPGDKVGGWTLLREIDIELKSYKKHKKSRRRYTTWEAECECGTIAKIYSSNFRDMSNRGSLCKICNNKKITTHGMSKTSTYRIWAQMIQRCENEKQSGYEYYGGLGVKVCDRWKQSFANFLADMGKRPPKLQLDRRDPDGNYEPENCRWVTVTENIRNRRKSSAQLLRIKKRQQLKQS